MSSLFDQIKGKKPEDLDKETAKKLRYEDGWMFADNGNVYWYDEVLGRWVPQRKRQQEEEDEQELQEALKQHKKQQLKRIKAQRQAEKQLVQENRANSSIYVEGIPLDVTLDEIRTTFAKCGVIAVNLRTGEPRIKMYTDAEGKFKGDCFVQFMKSESCELAIELLNDTKMRPLQEGIKVSRAVFEDKPGKTTEKKALTPEEKVQMRRKIEQMQRRIAEWSDDEPVQSKSVILKHCFTLKELEEDDNAESDIVEDIKEGCSAIGPVVEVILYNIEPDGVVKVEFGTTDAAAKCVKEMDGRYFGGAKLQAELDDGTSCYRRRQAVDVEDDRLERFGQSLD